LDIRSTEMHLYHVKEYLEVLNASDSKLYSKTKKKLTYLSSELFQCIQLIADILEEESLNTEESEFCDDTSSMDNYLDEGITKITEDISETANKIKHLDQFTHNEVLETEESESTDSDNGNSDDYIQPIQKISQSRHRKLVVSSYGNVLQELSENQELDKYQDAKACADLLWEWYNARFFETKSSDFHYNIRHIPIWVRNIVLAYGKHVEDDTADKFCSDFRSWLRGMSDGGTSNSKYGVPYEVYELDKAIKKTDITLAANRVWDILFDHGLDRLSSSELGESVLVSGCMYNLCDKYNPSLMENYEYYGDMGEGVEIL